MRLSHARIVTDDVLGLARFYRELTGISPVGSEEYVEFRGDGLTLAIGSQRSAALFGGAAEPRVNRSVVLEFRVDDVDRERARLGRLVTEWVREPTTEPWGTRTTLFRDPDGNLIALFSVLYEACAGACCRKSYD